MVFLNTQLALATGVATIAVGVAWYLNPTASRRWRRLRLHTRHLAASRDPTPHCAMPAVPTTVPPGNAPVYAPNDRGCTHILALPAEMLVLILASKPLRAAFYARHLGRDWVLEQLTIGQALARAGTCCKDFAICVAKAATIVAGRNGWLSPVAGSTPMLRLSKLEDDTKRVHSILCDDDSWWSATTIGYDREPPGRAADRLPEFVDTWSQGLRGQATEGVGCEQVGHECSCSPRSRTRR